MKTWELLLIAVAVSMDAFAVAICKGLSMKRKSIKNAFIVGAYFGGFQALMPLIGFFLGIQFRDYITAVDQWVAFLLLTVIGAKMIKESQAGHEDCKVSSDDCLCITNMLVLAFATSIDALAIGITFAVLKVNILFSVIIIGTATFLFSFAGVKIGNCFGARYQSRAELTGGIILITMGIKMLVS